MKEGLVPHIREGRVLEETIQEFERHLFNVQWIRIDHHAFSNIINAGVFSELDLETQERISAVYEKIDAINELELSFFEFLNMRTAITPVFSTDKEKEFRSFSSNVADFYKRLMQFEKDILDEIDNLILFLEDKKS